uniref:Uncharacterized protein n=1 Tax=Daucus carota subsp. sativus TaxID=79200 RepID=A0A175YN03_DAUCS
MQRVIKVFMRTLLCKANLDTSTDGVNQTLTAAHTLHNFEYHSIRFASFDTIGTQSAQSSYHRNEVMEFMKSLRLSLRSS